MATNYEVFETSWWTGFQVNSGNVVSDVYPSWFNITSVTPRLALRPQAHAAQQQLVLPMRQQAPPPPDQPPTVGQPDAQPQFSCFREKYALFVIFCFRL